VVRKRHHGTLTFRTGPDGTVFRVGLPVQQRLS
jgi:nitrogen-specific signal transduction histidine kinase